MLIAKDIETLDKSLSEWKSSGFSVGFVPTMGALHLGHLSLIKQAISENNKVICSIFVNPTQFNDPKDLENYPNQIEEDLVLLKKIGCDLVFIPAKTDMYPKGYEVIHLNFKGLDKLMEGASDQVILMACARSSVSFLNLFSLRTLILGKKIFSN